MLSQSMKVLFATAIFYAVACSPSTDASDDETTTSDPTDDTTDDTSDQAGQDESATGSTCPAQDPPTYENFGAEFMTAHCTRCHSSTVTGIARNGATPNYDFDTFEGIVEHVDSIEALAAAGPKGAKTLMPPSGAGPSLEQRERLGEWLACVRQQEGSD